MIRTRMYLSLAAAGLGALAALIATRADAQQPRHDPDWPCIQRKVPTLSVVQVWSGPSVEEAMQSWRSDAEVATLARRLAARRMAVEDAEAAVASFAEGLDEADRADKLTLLFAGLFATLNRERSDVIAGIERYGRSQKATADAIRARQSSLGELRAASPDSPEVAALDEALLAEIRVFDDRRVSLTYVCEVPTLIEQRLFALARAIQRELPD